MIKAGDRVVVCIPDHKWHEWATGAAEALHDLTGKVARAVSMSASIGPGVVGPKNPIDTKGATRYLVVFDKPAPTWWENQTPPLAWWFDPDELVSEPAPAARLPSKGTT